MANEYNIVQAVNEVVENEGLDVYMWQATYDTNEKKIIKEEIWLQFTNEEAVKWKEEHLESTASAQ
jgi:hypothetical protein